MSEVQVSDLVAVPKKQLFVNPFPGASTYFDALYKGMTIGGVPCRVVSIVGNLVILDNGCAYQLHEVEKLENV